MKLVFTCEHGGNNIPEKYRSLFVNAQNALNSHRGIDYGSLNLFEFCKSLSDFSKSNAVNRLIIELNRSKHHPKLFSEFTASLTRESKSELIKEIYDPYRDEIEEEIHNLIKIEEKVLHISFHSFTPIMNDKLRNADIGILYDPSRESEKRISTHLKQNLKTELPNYIIRYNYPYLGKADGFTTYLRKKFPKNYTGIEMEINQKFAEEKDSFPLAIKTAIFNSIFELKKSYN